MCPPQAAKRNLPVGGVAQGLSHLAAVGYDIRASSGQMSSNGQLGFISVQACLTMCVAAAFLHHLSYVGPLGCKVLRDLGG